MKYIDQRKLNLKNAVKITKNTFESDIYVKGKKAYKMYKKLRFYRYPEDLVRKKKKAILLEDTTSKQIIKPDAIIYKDNKLSGIRMDYVNNLGTLYDFSKVFNDVSKLLIVAKNASLGLKEIHKDPVGIVVGDLNFYNIIFDEFLNTFYVDADSYEVGGISASSISKSFFAYCEDRGFIPMGLMEAYFDRFQFIFEFLSLLFGTNIENVTRYQYDELSEQIETLKNLRMCFKLIKKSDKIPNLPYLCDLVSDNDLEKKIEYDLPIVGKSCIRKVGKQLTR